MRSSEEYEEGLRLLRSGLTDTQVSRELGIPRETVRDWRTNSTPVANRSSFVFRPELLPTESYAYLFGLYLGDGYLAAHPRGVYALRIVLDDRYPMILRECELAMSEVCGKRPSRVKKVGCHEVKAYWKRWPDLFPQHGRGRKHEREIRLAEWQLQILEIAPGRFLRGLIQSDGCRFVNTIRHGETTYRYPRYNFTNASADIRRLFTDACDRLAIQWRPMNHCNISVAKRASVAKLDEFVGPKA
jgi:hypothetical protein